MNLDTLKQLVWKQWGAEGQRPPIVVPPEAKYISGIPEVDAHLHCLETEYGFELKLNNDYKEITGWNVVDENKFTLFILKYS